MTLKHTGRARRTLVAVGLLPAVARAHGAWPLDPAANLVLGDRASEQVQAKIVPTPDGGACVSWFDDADGGYDSYLQRLDRAADEQWAHNGILVADRGFSSTQDYGLAVDASGNALLAYRYDVGGRVQVYASKADAAGNRLWGAPGLPASAETAVDAGSPRVAATTDGHVVVAWSAGPAVRVAQARRGHGSALGFAVYAWTDGETPRDLLAQNLNTDGRLGPRIFGHGFGG
jgi:hypothetical protein